MSTHKATAARCLSYHQAAYGQPAIRALATAPLRRLALSVLFTIVTNSYQTTCTVSERTFNKRQHANAIHGVDFSFFTHYDSGHILGKRKFPVFSLCYRNFPCVIFMQKLTINSMNEGHTATVLLHTQVDKLVFLSVDNLIS